MILSSKSQNCEFSCENLIDNPSFDFIGSGSNIDLRDAFNDGYVHPWIATINTPHLVYQSGNDPCVGFNFNPSTDGDPVTYLSGAWDGNGWMEEIAQEVNFIGDGFNTYCIMLKAKSLDCSYTNIDGQLLIRTGNMDQQIGDFIIDSYPPTFLPGGNSETLGEITVPESGQIVNFNSAPFTPLQDYSTLRIANIVGEMGFSSVNIIDVETKCATSSLQGIIAEIDETIVDFSAVNASTYSYSSYSWDFGDGMTSSEPSPSHIYMQGGAYEVCLDIIDENGCCSSICEIVEILPPPTDCPVGFDAIFIDATMSEMDHFSDLVNMGMYSSGGTMTGEDIVIKGAFTLDTDFSFVKCNFFFESGAELIVKSPGSISIRDSELQGCNEMWKGITVEGQGPENFFWHSGGSVSDAYAGVEIKSNAHFYIANVLFNKNYVGIYAEPSTVLKTNVGYPIIGCTFTSNGIMLPMYPNQPQWEAISYAGALIHNMDLIKFIDLTFPFSPTSIVNNFDGIQNGIIAKHVTNVVGRGNQFNEMLWSNNSGPRGVGIFCDNAHFVDITNNNITDGYIGVQVEHSHNSIISILENEVFSETIDFHTGIYSTGNQGSIIDISRNIIELGQPSVNGILCSYSSNLIDFNIDENEILHSHENASGIALANLDFLNESNGLVYHNIIDKKLSSTCNDAIYLSNVESINFEYNIIEYEINLAGNNTGGCSMFSINYSPHCQFRDNEVSFPSLARIGFSQRGSIDNLFCCNTVTNAGNGFRFDGTNSPLNFASNTMDNCQYGLHLRNQIPPQNNKGNLWLGESSIARITAPFGASAQEVADASLFSVNSTQPLNPAMRPNVIIPFEIEGWFEENGFPNDDCNLSPTCGVVPYEFGEGNENPTLNNDCDDFDIFVEVLLSPKVLSLFQYQNDWVLRYYIYRHFASIPEDVWIDCTDIKNFMENDDHIKSYVRVDQRIRNVYKPTEAQSVLIDYNIELIATTIQSIFSIYDNVPEEYESFNPDLSQLQNVISQSSSVLRSINNSILGASESKLINILSDINTLDTQYDFEDKLVRIWTHKVKVMLYGVNSLTNIDWDEVEEIANGCPDADGLALFEARDLLTLRNGHTYNYEHDIDCDGSNKRSLESSNTKFNIYPNPTSDKLSIEKELKDQELLNVIIYSLDGRVRMSQKYKDFSGYEILDVSQLSSGIYILELSNNYHRLDSRKIVISK